MADYPWLPLSEIAKFEPEMRRLKVSEVARSPRGFLTALKKAGSRAGISDKWKQKRDAFIARHYAQYKQSRGYRQYLALIAWAYKPRLAPLR